MMRPWIRSRSKLDMPGRPAAEIALEFLAPRFVPRSVQLIEQGHGNMKRVTLLNTTFVGALAERRLEAYAERLRGCHLGLEPGDFGDTLRARSGEYALFEFSGRLTYLTLLAYDLGCEAAADGEMPRHRGYLIVDTKRTGHLEDALEAAADMVRQVKSGYHPALDDFPVDRAVLDDARSRDAVAERRALLDYFASDSSTDALLRK